MHLPARGGDTRKGRRTGGALWRTATWAPVGGWWSKCKRLQAKYQRVEKEVVPRGHSCVTAEMWERGRTVNLWEEIQGFLSREGPCRCWFDIFFSDSTYLEAKVKRFVECGDQADRSQAEPLSPLSSRCPDTSPGSKTPAELPAQLSRQEAPLGPASGSEAQQCVLSWGRAHGPSFQLQGTGVGRATSRRSRSAGALCGPRLQPRALLVCRKAAGPQGGDT